MGGGCSGRICEKIAKGRGNPKVTVNVFRSKRAVVSPIAPPDRTDLGAGDNSTRCNTKKEQVERISREQPQQKKMMDRCGRIRRKDGCHGSSGSDRFVPSARLCRRQPCQIRSILAQVTTPHGATLRRSRSSGSARNNPSR